MPGRKSSITIVASLTTKARRSLKFAVLAHVPGKRCAAKPEPKCCWSKAASAVLNRPVAPWTNTLKSTAPRMLRHTAPRVGTVTRSGARSSTARLARMALLNSAPVGGVGRINGARAAGREVSTGDRETRTKCTTTVQVGPAPFELAPTRVAVNRALDDLRR